MSDPLYYAPKNEVTEPLIRMVELLQAILERLDRMLEKTQEANQ